MYSYFSYNFFFFGDFLLQLYILTYFKCYYDVIEKNVKRNFLANSRVLIFQIKLRAQNYWNYTFLSLDVNNFANQKLRYDKFVNKLKIFTNLLVHVI